MQPAGVVTPEAVRLELNTANVGSRFCALVIDQLVQWVSIFLLFLGFGFLSDRVGGVSGGAAESIATLLVFAVLWGYPTAMETLWRGRTLGKAALGLRVVTVEGAPVRFRHAAIRAALTIVDFYLTFGAAALITAVASTRTQRLGDLVAGTLVLRERSALGRPAPATFAAPPGLESYTAMLDVARVRPDDYRAVRSFLLRAAALDPHVRQALAAQLAATVSERVRPGPPPGVAAEAFLACVAAAEQRRLSP